MNVIVSSFSELGLTPHKLTNAKASGNLAYDDRIRGFHRVSIHNISIQLRVSWPNQ